MPNSEDWMEDPLVKIGKGSYHSLNLKSYKDKQNDLWKSFHFSTRLKLNAAEHFCRQVFGASSMSYDFGLPLLAFSQLKWYLDAFFFEIISAYDTLLQELNAVYGMGLKPKQVRVRWAKRNTKESKFLSLLKVKSPKIFDYMEKKWKEEWFKNVRQYRNMAAHQHYVPTNALIMGYDTPQMDIGYLDDSGNPKTEEISKCRIYLKRMVDHIQQVWQEMAQEFE